MDTEDLFNSAAGDSQEEVREHNSVAFMFLLLFFVRQKPARSFCTIVLINEPPSQNSFIQFK